MKTLIQENRYGFIHFEKSKTLLLIALSQVIAVYLWLSRFSNYFLKWIQ